MERHPNLLGTNGLRTQIPATNGIRRFTHLTRPTNGPKKERARASEGLNLAVTKELSLPKLADGDLTGQRTQPNDDKLLTAILPW